MSRAISPSPSLLPRPESPFHSPAPSLTAASSSSTIVPEHQPRSTPPAAVRPPRAPLRVNTDYSQQAFNPLPPASASSSRLRSNSAQSHSASTPAQKLLNLNQNPNPNHVQYGGGSTSTHSHPSRQFSRSLSHNQTSSNSPISPTAGNDVAMAVNGLRGMLAERNDGYLSPTAQRTPIGEEMTLRKIQEAIERSNDEGDTLDLSRRGIESIGAEAVETFRRGVGRDHKGIWRLALSYNHLRDRSIVDSFSRLSRLRYLNLKGNDFTEFPPALTGMAALEILDLSKNRIENFPEIPGRLSQLKVLSLTHNRIYSLPAYLTTFSHLKVFKVDGNPIEWPPREVLGDLINVHDNKTSGEEGTKAKKDEDLRPWIENMKSWMRQRAAETDRLLAQSRSEEDAYLASEEEPTSAVSTDATGSSQHWGMSSQTSLWAPSTQQTIRPVRDDNGKLTSPPATVSQKRPALSVRNRSATVSEESLGRSSSSGLFPPIRPYARHDRSQSNSSFTPPHSASTASSSNHSRNPSTNLPPPPSNPMVTGHSRGASYTATQRWSANLTAKKSLPDLRLSHAKIIQDRLQDGQTVEESRPLGLGINTPGSNRFQNHSTVWADSPKTPISDFERPRSMLRKGSVDMLRPNKGLGSEMGAKRDSGELALVDESRNSYFRRLSTLPVSTISKTIPTALLKFIDAIRGILFALSQLHSALRQYLVYAVQDRVASVFTRVMEPAGNYMNNLINALDRFDSMSRRSTPPVSAVKGVIEATKESVAVFAKVVAVLRLQMPALKNGDTRYTRTLLLMIYGSMAEIGCSWSAMGPLISEIKPLLAGDAMTAARAVMGGHKMVATNSMTGRTPISPIPERGESRSPSSVARSSISTVNASPSQPAVSTVEESPLAPQPRSARSRRQGGSFSTQDVERGMLMGSPGAPSESEEVGTGSSSGAGPSASYARHRPSESAQIVLEDQAEVSEGEGEEETLMPLPPHPTVKTDQSYQSHQTGSSSGIPVTPPEVSQNPQPIAMVPTGSHIMRHGHHKQSSSSGSLSAGLPAPLRKLSVDVRPPTPASATLFDEDLLDVIETATDIAFTVWLKLAEDIGASSPFTAASHSKSNSQSSFSSNLTGFERPSSIPPKYHTELGHLLSRAEQITSALRESLAGVRANPLTWTNTSLPDDAQAFIKTVVKVSELVKLISSTHSFPSNVRQSCSRLTQATRECAILIQVSSLRPGSSTPALIPPQSATNLGSGNASIRSGRSTSPYGSRGNSMEDLSIPHSATSAGPGGAYHHQPPSSAGSISSMSGTMGMSGGGLRGLQLPTRHALSKSRSGSGNPPTSAAGVANSRGDPQRDRNARDGRDGRDGRMDGGPRSAQASQVAF